MGTSVVPASAIDSRSPEARATLWANQFDCAPQIHAGDLVKQIVRCSGAGPPRVTRIAATRGGVVDRRIEHEDGITAASCENLCSY
jgi:hypothetical protein